MYIVLFFLLSLQMNHQRKADIEATGSDFELPTNSKTADIGSFWAMVQSKELNTCTTMAKVKYYAKEKTMVSTNRPKVLAFASDIVNRGLTDSMPC